MAKTNRDEYMTFVVPNHFMSNNENTSQNDENIFYVKYSTKNKNENIDVRITTHCMIIVEEGLKVIHLRDNDIILKPKELLFLSQNNYFMSELLTDSNVYKAILVYFDDSFIIAFIKKYKIILSDKKSSIIKIDYSSDDIFTSHIAVLKKYVELKMDNDFLKLKLEEILLYSLEYNRDKTMSFFNDIVTSSSNRTQYILESNIDTIQSIEDMCKFTKLTPSALRIYMKKTYQMNPKVWLDKKRLEKASILLKNTDKSVFNIATDCGYVSISWFISQFKKQYNQTPQEYRYK